MDTAGLLDISDVVKRCGDHTVVDGINFSVAPDESFAFLDPSSCSDTTTRDNCPVGAGVRLVFDPARVTALPEAN